MLIAFGILLTFDLAYILDRSYKYDKGIDCQFNLLSRKIKKII